MDGKVNQFGILRHWRSVKTAMVNMPVRKKRTTNFSSGTESLIIVMNDENSKVSLS